MNKITIEFASRPKEVFENAKLAISEHSLFIVTKEDGSIVLFPFCNVISVHEKKIE